MPKNKTQIPAKDSDRNLLLAILVSFHFWSFTALTSLSASETEIDFLSDLQHRTFDYFWDYSDGERGLTRDRAPRRTFASVAAIGFALTAYPIGVERGFITRSEAIDRTWKTLSFLANAPQSTHATETIGYRGFVYHFLSLDTGYRFKSVELSSIDTALLMAGVLFCREYYDQDLPSEKAIRKLAEQLYERVEWTWMQQPSGLISHGWRPEKGTLPHAYRGYNEAMILYLLALGSPTYPIAPNAWEAFTSSYVWARFYGQAHVNFGPLFGHHYSHLWIDFRGIRDAYMKTMGIDYFENSRRATLAQRAYAIANPKGWQGYGAQIWGLTACDGPANINLPYLDRQQRFFTYTARGASALKIHDDGTLSPTAAGGSITFTPEASIEALREMKRKYGEWIYGEYGFYDAFNPSFKFSDQTLGHGRINPELGWFDTDYLGIDQGPILLAIENYRTQFVWETMKRSPYLQQGLRRAGFRDGWLSKHSPK